MFAGNILIFTTARCWHTLSSPALLLRDPLLYVKPDWMVDMLSTLQLAMELAESTGAACSKANQHVKVCEIEPADCECCIVIPTQVSHCRPYTAFLLPACPLQAGLHLHSEKELHRQTELSYRFWLAYELTMTIPFQVLGLKVRQCCQIPSTPHCQHHKTLCATQCLGI